MIVRRVVLVLAVSAAVLGLLGCSSSGDDEGAESASGDTTATTGSAESPDDSTPERSEDDADEPDDAEVFDAGEYDAEDQPFPSEEDAAMCALMVGHEDLITSSSARLPTVDDVAAVRAMADVAPEDILEDVQLYLLGIAGVEAAMADPLGPQADPAMAYIGTAEFLDASVALSMFAMTECGLEGPPLPS
jgi:hypothetical protein